MAENKIQHSQEEQPEEKLLEAPPEEELLSEHALSKEGPHKDLAELLYKQNVELSVRNRTLSLLRTLYQISIKSFEADTIAEKVTEAIRESLNFEVVGIMTYDKDNNTLIPLNFAKSEKCSEVLKEIENISLSQINIDNLDENHALRKVVGKKETYKTDKLTDAGRGLVALDILEKIENETKIKTAIFYPLIIKDKVIGTLVMCLNRDYNLLTKFEKEAIESFINVIAVALDRAHLYSQLKIANEKLKELDRLKSEFLSFASHQVKTPMSVVKGYASLINDGVYGEVPDKVHEATIKIKASANDMIDLVEDLLDLRKIEEGRMEMHFETVDLNKFVEDIVDELKTLADKKELDLRFTTNIPDAKAQIDPQKFRQVIQNYVENAIKYTKAGWVKVSIEENKENILITVSDSGLGMSEKLIPRLFKQFSRDDKNSINIMGTGLGLFIAKSIVEGHGGKTWAESDGEGKGSRFYVELPVKAKTLEN